MRQPRLAKMHLGINDAGQDVQPCAVHALAGRGAAEVADLSEFPRDHADVARADAVLIDEGPVDEDKVEDAGHGGLPCERDEAA